MTAMTTNEILRASLLDILFDNRNKDYGAYALRRGYNYRLLTATFGALSAAFLVFMMLSFGRKKTTEPKQVSGSGVVTIRKIELAPEKPQPLQKPKSISKPVPKIASVKLVNNFVIKKDFLIKEPDVPEIKELGNKDISNVNSSGLAPNGTLRGIETTNTGVENNGPQQEQPEFIANEREPEFPGGQEALIRFLRNNLNTPDELQTGETKTVQVRFLVGADGSVSKLEIVQSGGSEFDQEVIRVCKKMPRWKPAFQNGSNVAVSYILPVTFIGVEQ
jgi:protein TonB